MSLSRLDCAESIRTVLTCASEEFKDFYNNERLETRVLVREALDDIIGPNRERLREADNRYCLHDLLSAMLLHAPHPLGQRYVAVCLHIAHKKGGDGIVNAAKVWLDNLFLPMLAISKAIQTEPSSSRTPTADITSDKHILRAKVAQREQYRCAITKAFDRARVDKLVKEGRFDEIPEAGQMRMHAAQIIPCLLNNFDDKVINSPQITGASRTWDILLSWTRIDFLTPMGPTINSSANAIYMTREEHDTFGSFLFYLDKEAYPDIANKYRVRMTRSYLCLSNGSREVEVEFPIEESTVEPPNPGYLKVHAAFAKVLHTSGVAAYIERVERDAEMEDTLRPDGETDFASYLRSKIAIFAN